MLVFVSRYEKKNTRTKQDFDGSSGDEKDEERESLKKLYNEVLHGLCFPSDDTEVVKSRKITLARYVARMGVNVKCLRNFIRKI